MTRVTETCRVCNGKGKRTCRICKGRGGAVDSHTKEWMECPLCGGEEYSGSTCDNCDGNGTVTYDRWD